MCVINVLKNREYYTVTKMCIRRVQSTRRVV